MSKKPSKNKGMSSSFKASNIQTYAAGGEMEAASGGPGNPFALKRAMENSNFYLSPFYTNTRGSAIVPGYMVGFGTGMSNPKKGGWSLTGKIGQEYPGAKPLGSSLGNVSLGSAAYDQLQDSQALAGSAYDMPEWTKALTPHTDDKNISFGLDAAYRGPKMGKKFTPLVELGFDRSKSGGVGAYMTGGGQFDWGKNAGRNGELKPGYIAGTVGPYAGFNLGASEAGFNYGVQGRADWKPKALKQTPFSVYGRGHLGGSTTTGLSYGAEVGLRAPMKQIKQINLPEVDLPNMSSLIDLSRDNEKNNESEQEAFVPDGSTGWGKQGDVNASPIHKRWQETANDIYIPNQQGGNTVEFPPSEEGTESFAAGGPIKPPKWSLNYNPYSYNAANLIGGYEGFGNLGSQNLGISTPDLLGRENKLNNLRLPFSASVGLMNDKNVYNDTNYIDTYDEQLAAGQTPTNESLLASKTTPYAEGIPLTADLSLGIEGSGINPNMKKRSKAGVQLEGGYNPVSGFYGQFNSDQKWALGNNYTNALNRAGEWRVEPRVSPLNFQIAQKPGEITQDQKYEEYLQNNIATGNALNQFDPNNPISSDSTNKTENKVFASSGVGVGGQVKLPLGMLHGDVGVSRNWQSGQEQKYTPTANIGYSLPFSELGKIKNKIPKANLSGRNNFTDASFREVQEEEGQAYIPDEGIGWGESGKVNASPLHKQWQSEANDIYIPSGPTPGMSPMTYDPSMGEFQNNTEEMNNYSKGGGIHINPANKGKFTASANAADMGVQEFASHVLANKGSYTPLQIQRANFAHNAAGWQHAQGGFNNKGFQSLPPEVQAKIRSNSFADGGQLTEFNEGGTHEESPLGGIPQGMAPDGKMNLVEEGETKLNTADYIFSDQIKVDKETATLYGLPKGDIGKTFADVSKKVNRPNSRRDNDTIEQVAIQRDLENLMQAQEKQKEMQKDKDIAEFASKYPDLAQNMPVPGQEQQMMQPPMDPNAMQQGMMQEQMNPPAGLPQQPVDPAMMAQMQQMGQMPRSYGGSLFNCGGKMYNAGGYMYAGGGNVMRGIGAGAYGVGEGLLDTLTFGLTDTLTDKGFDKLAGMGGRSESEVEKDKMIRGFGNATGAIGGAILTGGATTSSALSEGIEGLTSGVTNIKGTDEKFDKIAGGIGQGASMVAGLMGPEAGTQAAGLLKGSEAVNKLMAAKQNPFINQATQFASKAFANGGRMNYSMYQPFDHVTQYGGPLNMPTNDNPYANFLAMGGGMEGTDPENPNKPTLAFNLNGIVANYTLEQAMNDPLVLEAFGASADEKGQLSPEDVEAAKLALEQKFIEEAPANRQAAFLAQQEYDAALSEDAAGSSMDRLPGETDAAYQSRMATMNTAQDAKPGVGEIKQTPLEGAMMALPAAYNIGRGIFGKPNLLNYDDYAQKANIDPYTMNIDPQLAEVRRAYAGANQAIKNASPGSGAYLGNLRNVAASKQEATNALYTKKEMFDKEAKYKTDMANRDINNSNLDLKMKLQTYNDAAKAAKAKSLQEGLGQLADIAKNEQGISLQEALLKLTSPDYAEKFNYSSLFEQAQKAAKTKKGTKAEK